MYSIEKMKKAARRRLKRLAQRSRDAGVVRRALAILRLGEDGSVALVAEQVSAARSSVYRWQAAYREAGIKGLRCVLGAPSRATPWALAFGSTRAGGFHLFF